MDELTKVAKFYDVSIKTIAPIKTRQIKIFFRNGYGISVICGPYSYGGYRGLLEVALLYDNDLIYDAEIGFDSVIGYQTFEDVLRIAEQVQKATPIVTNRG